MVTHNPIVAIVNIVCVCMHTYICIWFKYFQLFGFVPNRQVVSHGHKNILRIAAACFYALCT